MKKQYKQVLLVTATQMWSTRALRATQSCSFPSKDMMWFSLSFSLVGSAVSTSWMHDILANNTGVQAPAVFCHALH